MQELCKKKTDLGSAFMTQQVSITHEPTLHMYIFTHAGVCACVYVHVYLGIYMITFIFPILPN